MAPPTYDKLSFESTQLFTKHYNIGQFCLAIKSRAWSHLYLDLRGVFDLHNFAHSNWNLGASNLDAGLLVHDTANLGPVKVQVGTRVAFNAPLISGNLRAYTAGSWYRADGTADFEAGDTRKFSVSGVITCGSFAVGTKAEIDKTGQRALQNWTIKYRRPSGFCLSATIADSSKWNQNPWIIPASSRINYTLGIYQPNNPRSRIVSRGLELRFGTDHSQPQLNFGCSTSLNQSTLIKAKINSQGDFGVTGIYILKRGIVASISGLVIGRDWKAKFGCGLEFKE